MDEYVPARMPISSASEKPRSTGPPRNSSATTTMEVTTFVMMVRDSVWLIAWSSTTAGGSAAVGLEALADAVEHDDGIVERIADDGEDGRDHGEIERRLRDRENAEHQDGVVHHGEDGAERKLPGVKAERDVDEDEQQREGERPDARCPAAHRPPAGRPTSRLLDLRAGVDGFQSRLDAARGSHRPSGLALRRQTDGDIARGAEILHLRLVEARGFEPACAPLSAFIASRETSPRR